MFNIEKLKQIPIEEYARLIGLHPYKVGRYLSLKEHDSVRIDPAKNCFYRNSTGECGSVIDFAMAMNNMTVEAAIRELANIDPNGSMQIERGKQDQKKDVPLKLELPARANTYKNVFAYLIKSRRIDKEIVQELVDKKMLYQDEHNNCVFVSYNKKGNPIYANKRGTNTRKRFVADCGGCDYANGFFLDNEAKELIITESVIDALSVMTMYRQLNNTDKKYNWLALSGCTKYEKAIENHLRLNSYSSVRLCLDNDEAGRSAADRIKNYITGIDQAVDVCIDLPEGAKDYNDLLRAIYENDTY